MDLVEEAFPNDPRDMTQTGFRSNAAEYIADVLSLDRLLINNPAATFFVRVRNSGIDFKAADILVVDRSNDPQEGDWIVSMGREGLVIHRYFRPDLRFANERRYWGAVRAMVRVYGIDSPGGWK